MNLLCRLLRTIFPSPIYDGDSAFVVRITREEKPVHYTLQIQSFSLLKMALNKPKHDRYESQIFNAGGYKWKLALYPDGDEKRNGSDHISLYLVTAEDGILSASSEVNVVFTFLIYDNLRDKYLAVQDGKMRRFHRMKTEWGFEKLLSLDTFNDASNGFLIDDCCVFGVDIFVKKCEGGNNGEVLSLIKQPRNNIYTWKINNFSSLHQTYYVSDVFKVESCCWKIRMHPKNTSKRRSDSLSLYLLLESFEELSQGSQVYIEYEMAVLSKLGVGLRNKYKLWRFGVGEFWGTTNFISLSDLKEPTNGYICNDTLVVELKINAIFTLKKFLQKGRAVL